MAKISHDVLNDAIREAAKGGVTADELTPGELNAYLRGQPLAEIKAGRQAPSLRKLNFDEIQEALDLMGSESITWTEARARVIEATKKTQTVNDRMNAAIRGRRGMTINTTQE